MRPFLLVSATQPGLTDRYHRDQYQQQAGGQGHQATIERQLEPAHHLRCFATHASVLRFAEFSVAWVSEAFSVVDFSLANLASSFTTLLAALKGTNGPVIFSGWLNISSSDSGTKT